MQMFVSICAYRIPVRLVVSNPADAEGAVLEDEGDVLRAAVGVDVDVGAVSQCLRKWQVSTADTVQ